MTLPAPTVLNDLAARRDSALLFEALGLLQEIKDRNLADRGASSEIVSAVGKAHAEVLEAFSGAVAKLRGSRLPSDIAADLPGHQGIHGLAHFMKPGAGTEKDGVRATVFGFELRKVDISVLASLPLNGWRGVLNGATRRPWLEAMRAVLIGPPADTQSPINDISIWHWGFAVGTLAKAALPSLLNKPLAEAQVRVLSVAVDRLAEMRRAARIPDLEGRLKAITRSLDDVRNIVEEQYAAGNEQYRDLTGSYFIVADDVPIGELQPVLLGCFPADLTAVTQLGPSIQLSSLDTHGLKEFEARRETVEQLVVVPRRAAADHLTAPHRSGSIVKWLDAWDKADANEICTACGVLPVVAGTKAGSRHVCESCLARRARRSAEWLSDGSRTIWIEEACDENGRFALLAGRFDLGPWLDGTRVEKLERKLPSPAFFDAMRETLQDFWKDWLSAIAEPALSAPRLRKVLSAMPDSKWGPTHVYLLAPLVDGHPDLTSAVSAVWDRGRGCFVSADSSSLYGSLPENVTLQVFEPGGYGGRPAPLGAPFVAGAWQDAGTYIPAIELLAEPELCLVIVPAAAAVPCIERLHAMANAEFSAVPGLVDLHAASVFCPAATPVRAAIDAARRLVGLSSDLRVDPARVPPVDGASFTFDFEYLDSTGDRFGLARVDGAARPGAAGVRPHALAGVQRMRELWELLERGLATRQIRLIVRQIESKRRDWREARGGPSTAFQAWCADLIASADWRSGWTSLTSETRKALIEAASDGMLSDAVDLHLRILKMSRRNSSTTDKDAA